MEKRLNHFFQLMHDNADLIHTFGNQLIPIKALRELSFMKDIEKADIFMKEIMKPRSNG